MLVSGIPKGKSKEEVKAWLLDRWPTLNFVYLGFCCVVKKAISAEEKLKKMKRTKAYLLSYKLKVLRDEGVTEEQANAQGISLTPKRKV